MNRIKDFVTIRLDHELKGELQKAAELESRPLRTLAGYSWNTPGTSIEGGLHAGFDLAAGARHGQEWRLNHMQEQVGHVQVTQQELKDIFDLEQDVGPKLKRIDELKSGVKALLLAKMPVEVGSFDAFLIKYLVATPLGGRLLWTTWAWPGPRPTRRGSRS